MFIKKSENTAIVYKEKNISYTNLLNYIDSYANLLKGTSKVAIFSENRPEWVFALYATWRSESINVPIDFMSAPDELAYILNDCRPEVIFCSNKSLETVNKALPKLQYDIDIINFDSLENLSVPNTAEDFPGVNIYNTALIIYTSGTTGSPKGVMLSFDNILANIESVTTDANIFNKDERVLVLLPIHHTFPLIGSIVAPLFVGGKIAFSPSMNSEDIIKTLNDNKITILIGVPRFYAVLRKGIKDKINKSAVAKLLFNIAEKVNSMKFSRKIFKKVHDRFGGHVKYLVCGGAAIETEVEKDYYTLGLEILVGYGMTEAAPMITFPRPGKTRLGSSGQSMKCNEVKIVENEVITKGRNVMQGYYNKPEETAEILKDGWLYTGDLGRMDEEGYLFITGRKKELIVLSNGKNISPFEIEEKLVNISNAIGEIGVFQKDDSLNAVIYPDMKIISEQGIPNIEEYFRWEVIDKYNQKAVAYKKITQFIISTEELPKTRLGKIKRFALIDFVKPVTKSEGRVIEPEFPEYYLLKDFLKDLKGKEVLPNDHFEMDLSLDSLDKVSLQVYLESAFGITLETSNLFDYPTVEKLAQFINKTKTKTEVESINWSAILQEKLDIKLPKSWFTHSIFKSISKYILMLYFRLRSHGHDKLPDGPFILAPNHQSFFDGLFVSVFLKNRHLRKTYYYAKEKHVRNKIVKFIANRHNVIIMDINKDLKLSLQKMAEVLRKGKNIMIFPEGTRSVNGNLGNFKKTFAILARELNVPVIPVAIKGAFDALPKGSIFPKPLKKIEINFLPPVYPERHSYESLSEYVYESIAKVVKVEAKN